MDILDQQLPPPKSWEKFEDLSRSLFAAVWDAPTAQKNGRQGQAQAGVDVYAQPNGQPGKWFGVQCKGKSRGYNSKATKRQFDTELLKAETFEPPLSKWIFATTAPNDAKLQEHVRKVNDARLLAGKFAVEVLGWDDLHGLISAHPNVFREFYAPSTQLGKDPISLLSSANLGALNSIEHAFTHGQQSLTLLRDSEFRRATEALADYGSARLSGEGGTGKSAVLYRTSRTFQGNQIVLKDNRISARTLQEYLHDIGIDEDSATIIERLGSEGSCLCAIDGADRLLLSDRRDVVIDLFKEIASSSHSSQWKIVTTARHYRDQDVVASALVEAGLDRIGASVPVEPLDDRDARLLGDAFPLFRSILARDDLGRQNRNAFILKELFLRPEAPDVAISELRLADAWFTRSSGNPVNDAHRSKALSEIGSMLITDPSRRPTLADINALGGQLLIEEGALSRGAGSDTVALSHDVHEDWVLARSLSREPNRLPSILHLAGQPLWWTRAVRLAGQIQIENGAFSVWADQVKALEGQSELDPGWMRSFLTAPFHTELSDTMLPALLPSLLADEAALLKKAIETLIVFDTSINERLLLSPALAELSEAERYSIAAYWKIPNYQSWSSFLRWSLPLWEGWPTHLIPRLSELAAIFNQATEQYPNRYAADVATISSRWLVIIEDARHAIEWDDGKEPFDLELADRDGWKKVETNLRWAVRDAMLSAPSVVSNYLQRIALEARLESPRRKLLGAPGQLPTRHAVEWTDLCVSHFLRRKRRYRHGPDDFLRGEYFSFYEFNDAGIHNDHELSPSAPNRAGLADLFKANETAALSLFHKLEMRAAVFWRWYSKCSDQTHPVSLVVRLPGASIPLWGNETVYRWSSGILGPDILGSAYLALENWMTEQAENGRSVEELISLVLQRNGLVATAAICIAVLKENINTAGAISSAGPFLAEPRLWDYDIRKHIDDQGGAFRIGFFSRQNVHYQALEKIYERRNRQQPLSHSLLLPFRLLAPAEAQTAFDDRRAEWTSDALVDFEEQRTDENQMQAFALRIERCRSDSDRSQITMERGPEENQILVNIAPPAEAAEEIAALDESRALLNRAMRLLNWADTTRERGAIADAISIEEAIALADEIEGLLKAPTSSEEPFSLLHLAPTSIVAVAAIAATFGDPELLQERSDWILDRLLAGARYKRNDAENALTIDQAILVNDPQVFGAWGLAAYACRLDDVGDEVEQAIFGLTVQRLQAVTEAVIKGLLWDRKPDFVRAVHIAALDSCIIDIGKWWDESRRAKASIRTTKRRIKIAKRSKKNIGRTLSPEIPPDPYRWKWVWTKKWRAPFRRLKLKAEIVWDWNRGTAILKAIQWPSLAPTPESQIEYLHYLNGLVRWTRIYSEDDADRYDAHFPYEWAHALAAVMGRFAEGCGQADAWRGLLSFEYHDRASDLIGDYVDACATQLVDSGRSPDTRFWSAWQPPVDWLLQNAIPKNRRHHEQLSQAARAAGFVGPYMTPIPPDWPWVEEILPAVDKWVGLTCHLPEAALSLLPIVDRMSLEQRAAYFISWTRMLVDRNGSDESFWSYGDLGDRVSALMKSLANSADLDLASIRFSIAKIADAGSNVAREIAPMFAVGRSSR